MSRYLASYPPRLSCVAMSDNLTLSDMIRIPAAKRWKSRKSGPAGALEPPEGARRDASDAAEASENAARSARSSRRRPPRSPGLARACGRPHPKPPGHRTRSGALLPIPGTAPRRQRATRRGPPRRERPPLPRPNLPAPPRRGPRPSWVPSPRLVLQRRPGGHARPKVAEDRRDQAAGPSAPAPAAPVGGDGRHAPADAGAPPDPKRDPHRGVRDGADGRKPEGAALETQAPGANPPALLPSAGRLSGRLAALAETAKAYARSAQADNTQRAYAADWRNVRLLAAPPGSCGDAARSGSRRPLPRVSSRARRRRAFGRDPRAAAVRHRLALPAARPAVDIRDRHIATVLAGIRRRHARPPCKRPRSSPTSCSPCWRCWTWTCGACATGRFWRSVSPAASAARKSSGSIADPARPKTAPAGSKSSRRRPPHHPRQDRLARGRIGRGSRADTCPVALLETWIRLGRISTVPYSGRSPARTVASLGAPHRQARRPVGQECALAAGLRGDLAEGERRLAFGGHSCARVSPPPPRSRRPTSRSISATPAPK